MAIKQLGPRFAEASAYCDYEQTAPKGRTEWRNLLPEIDALVPWQALTILVEPRYPATSSNGGRPPFSLATMHAADPLDAAVLLGFPDLPGAQPVAEQVSRKL